MTLAQMKRQLARIKRAANIDFEKQAYEEATERHWNRLRRIRLNWVIADKKKASGKKGYKSEEFLSEKVITQRQSEVDRALAGDTPEKWRKDQAIIESYHFENYGHLDRAKRFEAFGADKDEMWSHKYGLVMEGVRKAKEQPKALTYMAQCDTKYVKRPREKPIRLHPSFFTTLTGGFDPQFASGESYYTPEFADGRKDEDLAQFYPCSDYPEFDGKTIIEFYDKKS